MCPEGVPTPMQIRVVTSQPWDVQTELLVVPVPAGEPTDEAFVELDRRLGGALAAYRRMGELTGKPYETALVRRPDRPADQGVAAEWVLALGSGEPDDLDRQVVLRLGAAVLRRLAGRQLARLAVWMRQGLSGGPDMAPTDVAQLLARGLVEGSYDPAVIYRGAGDETPPRLDELVLVAPEFDAAAAPRGGRARRDHRRGRQPRPHAWRNRASNDVSPEVLADEATAIAEDARPVDRRPRSRAGAAELGMGMFLAVGRGSDNPPRLIVAALRRGRATDARGRLLAHRRQGRHASTRAASASSRPIAWKR